MHTTGVVQQITSVNDEYTVTDTLDLAGGPLPETLIATPDGDLYVGVFGSGLANGIIQGVSDSSGTWEVFSLNVGPFMHPIVGLAADQGELWALESVPAGAFLGPASKIIDTFNNTSNQLGYSRDIFQISQSRGCGQLLFYQTQILTRVLWRSLIIIGYSE